MAAAQESDVTRDVLESLPSRRLDALQTGDISWVELERHRALKFLLHRSGPPLQQLAAFNGRARVGSSLFAQPSSLISAG